MRWEAGGMGDEESTMALVSGKDFHYYITSKKNQRPQQLCRSGKLTGDNGENRDEFQKTPFSLLAPVKKGTSDFLSTFDTRLFRSAGPLSMFGFGFSVEGRSLEKQIIKQKKGEKIC